MGKSHNGKFGHVVAGSVVTYDDRYATQLIRMGVAEPYNAPPSEPFTPTLIVKKPPKTRKK